MRCSWDGLERQEEQEGGDESSRNKNTDKNGNSNNVIPPTVPTRASTQATSNPTHPCIVALLCINGHALQFSSQSVHLHLQCRVLLLQGRHLVLVDGIPRAKRNQLLLWSFAHVHTRTHIHTRMRQQSCRKKGSVCGCVRVRVSLCVIVCSFGCCSC